MVNENTTGSFYCQSESCREIIRNIPPPPPPKLVRQKMQFIKRLLFALSAVFVKIR